MKITYSLRVPNPATQVISISILLEEFSEESLLFTMPVWTPGSYLVRDFSKHVRKFDARTQDGFPAEFSKKDKSTWKVSTRGLNSMTVNYEVYAADLTVRTSHADSHHVFITGTSVFMYIEGYKDQAVELQITPIENWRIFTTLDKIAETRYRAINYDLLVDSPIEIGQHRVLEFRAAGKDHEIIVDGACNCSEEKLKADVARIVEAHAKVMGQPLYRKYQFIVHLVNNGSGYGGLEHLNSCSVMFGSTLFSEDKTYVEFLELISHEYFHSWNAKRIRPVELGPFNYREENYSQWLWFCEGLTEFFGELAVLRAGLMTRQQFYKKISGIVNEMSLEPGSWATSLAESSFDSWIRRYKPSPDDYNTYVSYYTKGELIGFLMSIHIADQTRGARCIDDLLHNLAEKFRKDGKGFTEKDILTILKEITGQDYSEFFRKYIRGHEEPDFQMDFAKAGLKLEQSKPGAIPRKSAGIIIKKEGEKYLVGGVLENFPGFESGINAGDEIVAINGIRMGDQFTFRPFEDHPITLDTSPFPGNSGITLTFFRKGFLLSAAVEELKEVNPELSITEATDVTEAQTRIRDRVLGL
ncbi:MAG: hypothetical protein M1533_02000 [Candidatus Thermoplasmatota archaeon]|jgi:predicted metalloprotease with PDZ domain|nr:hypothetical protein [Candidatus Thermoplasmatota archaeon]MCL5793887.1 hypothetical protein [Candidatus Thermoplasmatota archaeon]